MLFIWQVDDIREMVDNDLGFQQAPLTCSRTKTLLFISNDKKVIGCLIAEHIQWVSKLWITIVLVVTFFLESSYIFT